MLLLPHVLIRLLRLLQGKHPLIHHRLQPRRIDRLVHRLELLSRPDQHAPHGAHIIQTVQEPGLVFAHAAEEADDGDDAFGFDGFEGLCHGFRTADFEDVGAAGRVGGEFLGGGAPVRVGSVVDDVVGAELFERLGFVVGRGGGDDAGAGCFGELL